MVRGRYRDRFVILQYVNDALAVTGGLFFSWWLKFRSGFDPEAVMATDYVHQFWWAFLIWMLSLSLLGTIAPHPRVISFNRARRILYASVLAILVVTVHNYFARNLDVSRILYPLSLFSVSISLLVTRFGLQCLITHFLITRGIQRRVLIVGLTPVGLRLAARFRTKRDMGYELVGFISLNEKKVGKLLGGVPVMGTPDDLRRLVRDNNVEEVFVAQADIPNDVFFKMFIDSEKEWAKVSFVPSLVEMMRSQIHYDEVAGVPIYAIRETPLQGTNAGVKRAFDLCFGTLGLVIISPLLLLIAILVKRSSAGPMIYKQNRLGLDGKGFNIYKFRTMPVNSEKQGPGWGGQEDSRSTPIGRLLRRWNLDELPQLWNVVRGDMSLVGPRPERPVYVDQFREMFPRYMSRHAVKTGMTGWAQVHGLRGDTSIQQRLRFDLYYIENWSLWLDVKILILTVLGAKRRRPRSLRNQSMRVINPQDEITANKKDPEQKLSTDQIG